MTDRDRAVSDVLGYVFVFAIITITIALVFSYGISGLLDVQSHQQVENVELAFGVLDTNIEDVTERGAKSRATEIKLSGGTISVGAPVIVHAKTNTSLPAACNATRQTTVSTRPIVYRKGTQRVVYSMGATFRTAGTKSSMVTGPDWVIGSESAIVSMVTTTTVGGTSTGGTGSIVLVARERGQKLRCSLEDPGPVRVNVTLESPRAPAWERYFREQGYDIASSGPDRVVLKFTTRQFYLADTTVEVEYIS